RRSSRSPASPSATWASRTAAAWRAPRRPRATRPPRSTRPARPTRPTRPTRATSRPRSSRVDAPRSRELFERARRVIPGGVNSPVRAFGSVGLTPRFLVSGSGCRVRDADGREYLDYVGSWGPLILGHADPGVL